MAAISNSTLHDVDLIPSDGEVNGRFQDLKFNLDNTLRPIDGYQDAPSLSLESSLTRVESQLHDLPRYIRLAKQSCQQPIPDNLTRDEAAAIRLYTMEWTPKNKCLYFVLNQELRNVDREKLKPWFAYLKLLMTALYRLKPQSRLIFRGVKGDISKKYRKDASVIWWAFRSCTTSLEILTTEQFLGSRSERTLFIIECFSGRDISRHSIYSSEGEILLPPGRQFLVTSVLNQTHGLYIVHLKEQVPIDPLIAPPFVLPDTSLSASNSLLTRPCRNRKLKDILNKHLSTLDAACLNINDDDMQYVAQYIRENQTCNSIDLSSNTFTSVSMISVDIMLRAHGSIETLKMCSNHLSDVDIDMIMRALRYYNTLVDLNFAENNITDIGLQSIVEFLQHNESLRYLNLNSNKISDSGISQLSDVLSRRQFLKELFLSQNQITDISNVALIQMLKQNQSLLRLDLDNNKFTAKSEKLFRQEAMDKDGFVLAI